jgi:predicted aldo/keto reductase-like oxidoreductase/phage gpG-like protein
MNTDLRSQRRQNCFSLRERIIEVEYVIPNNKYAAVHNFHFTSSLPTSSFLNIAMTSINEWARTAIADAKEEQAKSDQTEVVDPHSNKSTANQLSISIARKFLKNGSPKFLESKCSTDDDRLVKVGRSLSDLVTSADNNSDAGQGDEILKQALLNVVDQCDILASHDMKVPKVRFGKTGIDMPILTLGCMRFQQTWDGKFSDLNKINPDCQDGLTETIYYAVKHLGINHIETARAYGSSELQIGQALKNLVARGIKREDLIIQTKVNSMPAKAFRETLENSFRLLGLEYIDLFSFHGVNQPFAYDLIFNNEGEENLMDIIKEYQAAGKIKHIGFSTHAQPELIKRFIETDQFEFANVHYHAFGSYTASGGGECGGNLENVRLMKEKDMGVFVISPYDKGGKLYAPSKTLRALTLPDLEPIQYGPLWLMSHEHMDEQNAPIHTMTIGAARPSDLDEPFVTAYMFAKRREEMLVKVQNVAKRLHDREVAVLGEEWVQNWHKGLRNCLTENDAYEFGQIVWCHNLIKAFGMLDYAKDRYAPFDNNFAGWDFKLSNNENIMKSRIGWGYCPGIATPRDIGVDYASLLSEVPENQKAKILEAIYFTYSYCSKKSTENVSIPEGWECAYDMRPWTAFCERG